MDNAEFTEMYAQYLDEKRQAIAATLGEATYVTAAATAWKAAVEATIQAGVEARSAARRKLEAERRARKPLRGRALRNHRINRAIRHKAESNWAAHLTAGKG